MWRALTLAAVVVLCAGRALAGDPIEGKWSGTTGFPTDRVPIAFEIKRNEKQELKMYLYQSVTNFYGLEVPGVLKPEGDGYVLDDWRISLKLVDGRLEGTYFS